MKTGIGALSYLVVSFLRTCVCFAGVAWFLGVACLDEVSDLVGRRREGDRKYGRPGVREFK